MTPTTGSSYRTAPDQNYSGMPPGVPYIIGNEAAERFSFYGMRSILAVYGWFYLAINLGSSFSTFICPILLNDRRFGSHYAFGLPGILMAVATVVFWMGRKKFVHVPPGGLAFVREFFSAEGFRAIGRLFLLYIFVAVFWSLWDQSAGGEWTLQARGMDLHFLGFKLLPEQVQIANPVLILLLVPVFNYLLYRVLDRLFPLTPLRKLGSVSS